MELSPIDVRDGDKIERDIAAFARESNGGLIVTASSGAVAARELIIILRLGTGCLRSTPSATS